MRVTGAFEVAAPPKRVWDSLWAAETLPAWIPGCKHVEWTGPAQIVATVEQTIALLKAGFQFDLTVVERQEQRHVRLQGSGSAEALGSAVQMDMALNLAPAAGGTSVQYEVEVAITGRLATIGDFVLKAKAKDLQRELVKSVKSRLESA